MSRINRNNRNRNNNRNISSKKRFNNVVEKSTRQQRPRQQQRPQQQKKFCTFCKKLGKDPHGHFVKECQELQKIKCKHCGKNGHTIRYCPYVEKCKFCDRVGHTEDKCFYNPTNNIQRCSECNGYGHTYEECYHVSKEDKEVVIKEREVKKEEIKKVEQKNKSVRQLLREAGVTECVRSLSFYRRIWEKEPSHVPWVCLDPSLTPNPKKEIANLKRQVKILTKMEKENEKVKEHIEERIKMFESHV